MSLPLRAVDLSKRYADRVVLDGVSLELRAGEVVALLGPNGAGKSTLIGCACGTVIPDAGTIEIAGHDLRAAPIQARRALRYLAQESDLPPGLTGRELLEFHADVFDARTSLAEAERLAGLGSALDLLATTYSVGMRRRLAFAALACGDAALYVLDEPFAGVDGESCARLAAWLVERRAAGAAILLAAHDQDSALLDTLDARPFSLSPEQSGPD
ncbi:ATP-binding cassette domain-containing protein [Enhygromyxa salina]|uniref:Daunorubicin/doxorubicin resistance ATP-binding protein DrrA n=1 Tax=Enhygromyxa salina TaxID=215803 RepID=A0A2S9YQG8_9BACT|nr:ABC transporter ATP-binding protein [Enhygromyxa salina]PRQ07344.1 Daunorubicin/doxorubicin resistance ATP-binding protein DrrA [Enhygromyxa salina]